MNQLTVLKTSDINALSLLFRAFSNEYRLAILNLLRQGPMNVGDIVSSLKLDQTVVSHNLRCLAFCGLVSSQQAGKTRVYSVNKETVEPLLITGGRHVTRYATNLRDCESLER